MRISQPLRALCFSLSRYRINRLPLLCSSEGPHAIFRSPLDLKFIVASLLAVSSQDDTFFFDFRSSGIKRMRAAVSPPVQMNADLSTTARALFFLSRAIDQTDSPSFMQQAGVATRIICAVRTLDSSSWLPLPVLPVLLLLPSTCWTR